MRKLSDEEIESNLNSFLIKLNWDIEMGNVTDLQEFRFSNFRFVFLIEKGYLKEFVSLLKAKRRELMPWEVCSFFIERNLNFKMYYKYDKYNSLRNNIRLFYLYIILKKELRKIKKEEQYV